ncbi:G_PROTEIN_RECEP_F1_2 domain-containing protein [Caenorhabditis elegans]|uniref:G_PROTEIN_RECEP_F1_2 domain-containing protein n=1 Tax=Caenorhabditis elegans TaxID=6239 RepID=Q20882_CAEEL|nr:G_PROTEIN_RECEP_F1_2 domain-containing protein [Caenorhabditis elegans]CAA93501.1 G_PROTEIN_RECEP_F1_2 domain-containing protein [Caenorhabditis elegans]|eukprot:NP_501663.1 Serpentine Receptor, class XA [Caenorhabditis elegans]
MSSQSGPFIYIIFMTIFGISEKLIDFLMVDAWPISEWIEPNGGYQKYRHAVGTEVSLLFTICYLAPLFLDWIMTFHRMSIFISPIKSSKWFSDTKVVVYCTGVTILITIWLLIPYFSNCSLNFNALTSYHESACAPSRHPITLFQNNFLIYVPIVSMVVNSGILIYQKYLRNRWKSTASSISLSHVKRENEMIRQACFIGVYLSVYEILYLHMRLYPQHFENLPFELQTISYDLRLLAISSLNFFVYFVLTKSTRKIVLKSFGSVNHLHLSQSFSHSNARILH